MVASSDDLHHAIDAAAGVLAASILDSARERDARDAFKFALHKLTGRFASFAREDVLTVNRLILERLGDPLTDRLRASGRLPDEIADVVDHEIVEAVCLALNSFESQL